MKVGVDGVLLGAWADVSNARNILDVGTGTGLIALMLAQRSLAKITAIEIEEKAATEAKENVTASPWKNRVEIKHISFQEFVKESQDKFDLVVSNPPFFERAQKSQNTNRAIARHNDSLPFSHLIKLSAGILGENGRLAVIVPFDAIRILDGLAQKNHLFLQRITEIKPHPDKATNRVLLEWGKKEGVLKKDCLTIYNTDNSFNSGYINLTKDFYLKF